MSEINKNRKVSVKRIVGNVIDRLELKNVSSRISAMSSWVVDAEIKIGSRNSYVKHECEIEVKNYRACLPENFVKLIAVKQGNDHLDVTFKDFRQFHKSASNPAVSDGKMINGNKVVVNTVGQPNAHQVNVISTFAPGDILKITVMLELNGEVTSNIYEHEVSGSDTVETIIESFVSQINLVYGPSSSYKAISSIGFFQIVANNNLVNLTLTLYMSGVQTVLSKALIQARVKGKTKVSETDENCEVNVPTGSENLANRHTVLLNDGIFAEGSGGASKYALENGYIHFTGIENGKVGIAYTGIALDEDGWPLIDQEHEDAVTQYVIYMLSFSDYRKGKITASYHNDMKLRWFELCNQARGDDELPNEDELQFLSNIWNQLMPTPNLNYF